MTPFYINDCALAAIATGVKARTLSEFRDRLETIHPGSIYFHFWIGRLRPAFEFEEHHNDFSYWIHNSLHDDVLAERIELLDPVVYSVEELRSMMIEIIEHRLDEHEWIPISRKDQCFHFIRSTIIVFKTNWRLEKPQDLVKILPLLPNSSVFYHFIDARRRTEKGADDFTVWLEGFGPEYAPLIHNYREIDPYFISLNTLQVKMIQATNRFFRHEPA